MMPGVMLVLWLWTHGSGITIDVSSVIPRGSAIFGSFQDSVFMSRSSTRTSDSAIFASSFRSCFPVRVYAWPSRIHCRLVLVFALPELSDSPVHGNFCDRPVNGFPVGPPDNR